MARVPLTPAEPDDPVVAEVFGRFAREGREPIELYRALAHQPQLLRAYAGLAGALREEAVTPRSLRELVILRTAQLTGSVYEWSHHRAIVAKGGLVAEEKVAALAAWSDAGVFDDAERAALRCADEVHETALGDEAFAALRDALGEAGAVEIVVLAGFYQALARIIQALGLPIEPEYQGYVDGI